MSQLVQNCITEKFLFGNDSIGNLDNSDIEILHSQLPQNYIAEAEKLIC